MKFPYFKMLITDSHEEGKTLYRPNKTPSEVWISLSQELRVVRAWRSINMLPGLSKV